ARAGRRAARRRGRSCAERTSRMIGHFFADPEFWVLVAAIIFVGAVWKPAGRAITGGVAAPPARLPAQLDGAGRLRAEAEALVAEYRAKQQAAAAEAEDIVRHARAEAERIAAQAASDLDAALERRQLLAEERIAQAEAKALSEIRSAAIDVAI